MYNELTSEKISTSFVIKEIQIKTIITTILYQLEGHQ